MSEPPHEATWQVLDRVTALRKRLLSAGYKPIPTKGKAAFQPCWSKLEPTDTEIENWARQHPDALNTGILTRTTPAVDIDVLDAEVAQELHDLLMLMTGDNGRTLIRYGKRPKRAVLFQTDKPFEKIATPVFVSPEGSTHRVEVLCDGQQVVAHGTHPETGKPYSWDGGEPGNVPRDDLPYMGAELATEFILKATEIMRGHGWTADEKTKKDNGIRHHTATVPDFDAIYGGREQKFAASALADIGAEVASTAKGGRNDKLYRSAFRLGTMTARGWIERDAVIRKLLPASQFNGYAAEHDDTLATITRGLDEGEKNPHDDLSEQSDGRAGGEAWRALPSPWRFHTDEEPEPTAWLIKGVLPETGTALVSGMWGSFKTTVSLDIAVSVITGEPFAGRFPVKRKGGVAYIAAEGAAGLSSRLTAIARARGAPGALPFAYRSDCPPLTAPEALDKLTIMVKDAAKQLKDRFGVPLVAVFVDTVVTAAGYAKTGDDNDAAMAQKLMSVMLGLSQRTGALVAGVDHFGKVEATGTRGSSAKEGAADTVIALLAERELNGTVTNTRLTIRKQREGAAGLELPFNPTPVEIGTDQDGDAITRTVINWEPTADRVQTSDKDWSRSLRLLRQILMAALADGKDIKPFPDGPAVRACDLEVVRAEFSKQYPASGNARHRADARRKAFQRAVEDAQGRSLVGVREVEGVQFVWLARPGGGS